MLIYEFGGGDVYRLDEEEMNLDIWQLSHIAKALTRAMQLEKSRTEFHQELYECISYPSINMDPLNPRETSAATDAQAIRIIEAKERYDKLIRQEYERDVRWRSLLMLASEKDQIIMIRYFKKKKSISPVIISSLLSRLIDCLHQQELKIEKERSDISLIKLREERNSNGRPKNYIKTQVQFYENGAWSLMNQDKYDLKLQQKKAEQRRARRLQQFKDHEERYLKSKGG